jgi:hypothetical protein
MRVSLNFLLVFPRFRRLPRHGLRTLQAPTHRPHAAAIHLRKTQPLLFKLISSEADALSNEGARQTMEMGLGLQHAAGLLAP